VAKPRRSTGRWAGVGSNGVRVVVIVGAVVAVLFLLDRALLRMERRGWIYYRRTKGGGAMGPQVFQLFDPSARFLKREMEQECVRKAVRPSGDPPFEVDLDAGVLHVRHHTDERPRANAPAPERGEEPAPPVDR
jgi:hypothetical protein